LDFGCFNGFGSDACLGIFVLATATTDN
jgi:hypothetical protein